MSAGNTQVSRAELKKLLDQGLKYAEIARELNCSYSSVAHIARDLGYGRGSASHKEALPWTLTDAHKLSPPAQYLRDLSRLAQGLPVGVYRRSTALRWAQAIVDSGRDIAYDPDMPPNPACDDGGFYFVEVANGVNPDSTHVGRWLQAALLRSKQRV